MVAYLKTGNVTEKRNDFRGDGSQEGTGSRGQVEGSEEESRMSTSVNGLVGKEGTVEGIELRAGTGWIDT